MSIKKQVEDAIFLSENNRPLGALTNLLLAVAASSRKTFPKKKSTKSIENPDKPMEDREAFVTFFNGRLQKIIGGDYGGPDAGTSVIRIFHKGKLQDLGYILYKKYRNALIHEGELHKDVEFNPPSSNKSIVFSNLGASVTVTSTDKVVLEHEWIDLLVNVVTGARCNSELFGVEQFDLELKDGFEKEKHEKEINQKHDLEDGAYFFIKDSVRHITPEKISNADDDTIKSHFRTLIDSNVINGGLIMFFSSMGVATDDGELLPKGIAIFRDISDAYRLIKV